MGERLLGCFGLCAVVDHPCIHAIDSGPELRLPFDLDVTVAAGRAEAVDGGLTAELQRRPADVADSNNEGRMAGECEQWGIEERGFQSSVPGAGQVDSGTEPSIRGGVSAGGPACGRSKCRVCGPLVRFNDGMTLRTFAIAPRVTVGDRVAILSLAFAAPACVRGGSRTGDATAVRPRAPVVPRAVRR